MTQSTISNSIVGKKDLYNALIKARGQFPDIIKNNSVGGRNYKYEDLPGIYDLIVPILEDNNLYLDPIFDVIISEHLKEKGYLAVLKLRVCHSISEQCTEWSTYPLVVHLDDIYQKDSKPIVNGIRQSEAGLQTYLRRYHIKYILNLCGEEDDNDGSAPSIKSYSDLISDAQVRKLKAMLNGNKEREAGMCKYYAIQSLDKLPKSKMQDAIAILEAHASKDKQQTVDATLGDMIF